MKNEKNNITLLQDKPKTHPGGDHGAWFRFLYHAVLGPSFIRTLPIANALKLMIINKTKFL